MYRAPARHQATSLWCVQLISSTFPDLRRLAIRSPLHRCGKTILLDIVSLLCGERLSSANVSAAAVFRVVEARRPTLLIDEADTFLPGAEELRGRHLRSPQGRQGHPPGRPPPARIFSTYSAVAIALMGSSRRPCVPLRTRRRPQATATRREGRQLPPRPHRHSRRPRVQGGALGDRQHSADSGRRFEDTRGLLNRDADDWRRFWPLLRPPAATGGWAREAAALCCQVEGEEGAAKARCCSATSSRARREVSRQSDAGGLDHAADFVGRRRSGEPPLGGNGEKP